MTRKKPEAKSFFKRPGVGEIRRATQVIQVASKDGLDDRLLNLHPGIQSLELAFEVLPNGGSLKQGNYEDYTNPSRFNSYSSAGMLPFQMRRELLESHQEIPDEEYDFVGFMARPEEGIDRLVRLFPAFSSFSGARHFAYADVEKERSKRKVVGKCEGILVDDKHTNTGYESVNGATVQFQVPSLTKKSSPYIFTLSSIPVVNNSKKRDITWNLRDGIVLDARGQPIKGRSTKQEFDMKSHRIIHGRDTSKQLIFYSYHVAAYIAYAQKLARENTVPLDMNPFTWSSDLGVQLYLAARDSTVVKVPGKDRRPLTQAEISNVLMMAGKNLGANIVLYNNPNRDFKLQNQWHIHRMFYE